MSLDPKTKATIERFTTAATLLGEELGLAPGDGVLGAEALLAHYAVRHGMSLQDLMVNVASNVPAFYETWLKLVTQKPVIEEVKA